VAKVKIAPDLQDKVTIKDFKLYSKKNLTVITLVLKNKKDKSLTFLREVIVFTKDGRTLDLSNFENTYLHLDPYEEKYIKIVIPQSLDKLSNVIVYIKSFVKNN